MPSSYEPIASVTLSSNGRVDFTSIPQTFTDLVIVSIAKCGIDGYTPDLYFRFNSDTGSNYSLTRLIGNGSSATSNGSSSTLLRAGKLQENSGEFSPAIAQIQSYANTNVYKTMLFASGDFSIDARRVVALWRDTSAITSITVASSIASMAIGSVVSLYGIKAA